jgi:hypothetical protein
MFLDEVTVDQSSFPFWPFFSPSGRWPARKKGTLESTYPSVETTSLKNRPLV